MHYPRQHTAYVWLLGSGRQKKVTWFVYLKPATKAKRFVLMLLGLSPLLDTGAWLSKLEVPTG